MRLTSVCHSWCLQIVTVLSCLMAFCLNYTIFLNTTLNSALTQTMCGNLKVCITITLFWHSFFSDVVYDLCSPYDELEFVTNICICGLGDQDLGTVLIGWIWFGGLPFDWVRFDSFFSSFFFLPLLISVMNPQDYENCKRRSIKLLYWFPQQKFINLNLSDVKNHHLEFCCLQALHTKFSERRMVLNSWGPCQWYLVHIYKHNNQCTSLYTKSRL